MSAVVRRISDPPRTSPLAILHGIAANRSLLWRLTRRDVQQRYRGSVLGDAWTLITPLATLAAYTFAFSVVFQVRWSAGEPTTFDFALNMFVGIVIYGYVSECLLRAPTLVTSQAHLVKKVVFPLELLPVVLCTAALIQLAIGLAVWCGAVGLARHEISVAVVAAPLILAPLVLVVLGLVWLLAALGVYLRDMGPIVGLLNMGIMFLSPIFYPLSALPAGMRSWIAASPLSFTIEGLRAAIGGTLPDPTVWALQLAAGAIMAWLGFAAFQSMRRGFADVL